MAAPAHAVLTMLEEMVFSLPWLLRLSIEPESLLCSLSLLRQQPTSLPQGKCGGSVGNTYGSR